MPLFFVIGGFAGATAYDRLREHGGSPAQFMAGRVHRLLLPAVATLAVVALVLAAFAALGVPSDLLAQAGIRYGQPLWFLGVFLGCQTVLPLMLEAHRRAGAQVLLVLVLWAVMLDLLRGASGIEWIGYLNVILVWLTLQQIGFFLAEGRIDSLPRSGRVAAGLLCVLVLASAIVVGAWSPDLIANLNPPTAALLLVGLVQTVGLSLLRGPLRRWSSRGPLRLFTTFVTPRTMTIYLWHMPLLLAMAAATVALAPACSRTLVMPDPSSAWWWLTRPTWFALALVLTAVVSAVLGRIERVALPRPALSPGRAVQAVILAEVGILLLLIAGTGTLTASIAVALFLVALQRVQEPGTQEPSPGEPAVHTRYVRTSVSA
jgi:peptidoglycan/LPS O-acetylase OafA/YrhL